MEEGRHNGEGSHTEDGVGQDKQKCFKCLAPIVFFFKYICDLPISGPLAKAYEAYDKPPYLHGGVHGVGVDAEHPEDVEAWAGAGLGGGVT